MRKKKIGQGRSIYKITKHLISVLEITKNIKMFSCSMSDDEQESGCETVDGSPTSDSSGHDSPFAESSSVEDTHQNTELGTGAGTEAKPAVGTAVEPPVGIESKLNVDEHMTNTGKLSFLIVLKWSEFRNMETRIVKSHLEFPS